MAGRNIMERMVPEVEYLVDKGYFSRAETRSVVQTRMNFEYKLKAKVPEKESYWRYLAYEKALEELHVLRKAASPSQQQTDASLEAAIPRRIHFIYERATRRFKGELRFWHAWLGWCEASHGSKRFSRVAARALQLHPTEPDLWIRAAAWEFDRRANAAAARSLMQRALRMCAESAKLWAEYFRLELLYAAKLHTRRKVLGLEAVAEEASESEAALASVLRGGAACLVYKAAIKALPKDLQLREQLLEATRNVPLPAASELGQGILADVRTSFRTSAEAWALRARLADAADLASDVPQACTLLEAANTPSADARVEAGAALLEEGTKQLPTAAMWQVYVQHLHTALVGLQDKGSSSEAGQHQEQAAETPGKAQRKAVKRLAGRVEDVAHRAVAAGLASPELLSMWIDAELARGRPLGALEACRTACAAQPQHGPFWCQQLAMLTQLSLAGQEDQGDSLKQQLDDTIAKGLAAVPDTLGQALVWEQAFRALQELQMKASLEGLLPKLQLAVLRSAAMTPAMVAAVRASFELLGLVAMRSLYSQLFKHPRLGEGLFQEVLRLELQLQGQERLSDASLEVIHEAGVQHCGESSTSLWLSYCSHAHSLGKGIGKLHWRACRVLNDATEFIRAVPHS